MEHVSHASCLSRPVVPLDEAGCLALYPLQTVYILLQVWITCCCAVFQRGPDRSNVCQVSKLLGQFRQRKPSVDPALLQMF